MDKKKLFAAAAVSILLLAGAGVVIERGWSSAAKSAAPRSEKYSIPPKNVAIATGSKAENEPAIAISPVDQDTIVVGANDFNIPIGDGVWQSYHTTHDRGRTWKHGLIPGYPGGPVCALTGFRDVADPAVAADSDGNFYYAGLANEKLRNPANPMGQYGFHYGRTAVFVARSSDNGDSFGAVTIVSEAMSVEMRMNDMESLAVDPANGNIYITWSVYVCGRLSMDSLLKFSKSSDKGSTWSQPQTIMEERSSAFAFLYSHVVVDNTGIVHVTSIDFVTNSIRYVRSTDGGRSFSTPIDAAPITPAVSMPLPNVNYRVPSSASLAVDRSETNTSGNLYVTWSDCTSGDADVFLSSSHDGGNTWGDPVRVNNDTEGDGKDQFFSAVAVSAEGWVHVSFFDRRSDLNNTLLEYWWAISFDGGITFPIDIPMSNATFDGDWSFSSNDDFIGDYTSVAANNETVAGVWCDCRNGSAAAASADIFGAVVPYKELLRTNKFANVTIPWPEGSKG